MAVSTDPAELIAAAKCFTCLTEDQNLAVQTYVLATIAGGSLDPQVLMSQSACFGCLTKDQLLQVQAYLLCQIINA